MSASPQVGAPQQSVPTWNGVTGVQSHGRSLLVWPEATASRANAARLREYVGTGCRMLWLGEPGAWTPWLPSGVSQRLLVHRRLRVETQLTVAVERLTWMSRHDYARVVELQRSRSITPLTPQAYEATPTRSREWSHWIVRSASGQIIGVIHRQQLVAPIDHAHGERSLVCGLAVDTGAAGHQIGRALLDAAASADGTESALCFGDPALSSPYLLRQEWEFTGKTVEFVQWR
jgi:hypothetical protein